MLIFKINDFLLHHTHSLIFQKYVIVFHRINVVYHDILDAMSLNFLNVIIEIAACFSFIIVIQSNV